MLFGIPKKITITNQVNYSGIFYLSLGPQSRTQECGNAYNLSTSPLLISQVLFIHIYLENISERKFPYGTGNIFRA